MPILSGLLCLGLLSDVSPATFPAGWHITRATLTQDVPVQGSKVVRMEGGIKGQPSRLTFTIDKPVADRKLLFTVWLKGTEDNQWVSVDTTASRTVAGKARPAQLRVNTGDGYVTTQYARMSREWKAYSKTIVISRSAKTATLDLSSLGAQPFYVAAPSLTPQEPEMCDLDGPGVLRTAVHVWVQTAPGSKGGTVTFPVPIRYRDQVPLAIKLYSKPEGVLKNVRFRKRPDGLNWLCEAQVGESPKSSRITWEGLVYTRPRQEPFLPVTRRPEVPAAAAPWLKRTAPVQTDSPLVQEAAKKLSTDNPDLETYARRVVKFTCENRGAGGVWNKLDAVTALTCAGGGSCTNRANLAAALLRLRGIPTRTVAHLPTWAFGEPLYTHWLVEYWHPKAGWISMESTWGEFQPPAYTTAIIAISSPEDEDGSYDPLQTRWVLPGAPKWAVPYIGKGLIPSTDENQQLNWAKPERRIVGSQAELAALFERASRVFDKAMTSSKICESGYFKRIEGALKPGTAKSLASALSR